MAGELVFITGATGFIGFRVLVETLKAGYKARVSVRKESGIKQIKEHPLIAPYAESIDFVIVEDILAEGAFDSTLEGVTYIQHLASPLPFPTEDVEKDIILPAIRGTVSILHSALKFPSVRRVVITSSVVGIISATGLLEGDDVNTYSAESRLSPLPSAPFDSNPGPAYFASKALALDATDKFLEEKKPHFTIINVMPGFVLGRNELVTVAKDMLNGTNGVVLGPLLGMQMSPSPGEVADVRDVVRIHVGSMDETKIVGSKSFLLDAGPMHFDDALDIAKKDFPEAVKSGILPLGGNLPSRFQNLDTADTFKTFGKMYTHAEAAREVIGQYLELKAKE